MIIDNFEITWYFVILVLVYGYVNGTLGNQNLFYCLNLESDQGTCTKVHSLCPRIVLEKGMGI